MPCNYFLYPKNWKSEIRPAILTRANNRCEECGVENLRIIHRYGKGIADWEYWPEGMESEAWTLDGKKATKVILTIAHTCHDTACDNHDHLRCLCQRCHFKLDRCMHIRHAKETRMRKKKQLLLFL